MAVYKDNATGTWRVIYRFTNWKGERKQTQKRGFATKREAQAWEHEVMLKQEAKLDMTFNSFFEIYEADKRQRVKESTWESKSHVIRTKILPYFGNRKIAEIEPKDVIAWQNELMAHRDEKGNPYSADYLKTIHAQLTAIFNHAVNFYNLPYNPARRAGTMGNEMVIRAGKKTGFSDRKLIAKMATCIADIAEKVKESGAKDGITGFRELINWISAYRIINDVVKAAYSAVINKASFDMELRNEIEDMLITEFSVM